MTVTRWGWKIAGLAIALGAWPAVATAQEACTDCAPSGAVLRTRSSCPQVYPFLRNGHAGKVCSPTICPGSCFGYYRTQWSSWEQLCPGCYDTPVAASAPGVIVAPHTGVPPTTPPDAPTQPEEVAPAQPKVLPRDPAPAAPVPEPAVPTPPSVPKQESSAIPEVVPIPEVQADTEPVVTPSPINVRPAPVPNDTPGVTLPPVPDLPIGLPPQPPAKLPTRS